MENDRPWIIADLDGTLCDERHRNHLARVRQWDQYHFLSYLDEPWPDVSAILKSMHSDFNILMITGRPEKYRSQTLVWLFGKQVLVKHVLMRGNSDYRRATELKLDKVKEFFGSHDRAKNKVLFAIDDNEYIVEAYKSLGLNVMHVIR